MICVITSNRKLKVENQGPGDAVPSAAGRGQLPGESIWSLKCKETLFSVVSLAFKL